MATHKKNSRPQKNARRARAATNAPKGPMHPGFTLAQILEDTPVEVGAKWFGLSPAAFEAVLAGKAPMTKAMAEIAGTAFGTGAAPWLMMIENYDTEVARLEAKAKAKADAKVAAKEATNA